MSRPSNSKSEGKFTMLSVSWIKVSIRSTRIVAVRPSRVYVASVIIGASPLVPPRTCARRTGPCEASIVQRADFGREPRSGSAVGAGP